MIQKSVEHRIPSPCEEQARDEQDSPLKPQLNLSECTDEKLLHCEHDIIDLYTVKENEKEHTTKPFTHTVGLRGPERTASVTALFDNGAMVNSICQSVYQQIRDTIGRLEPSSKKLRMANGAVEASVGRWTGEVELGDTIVREAFEVFASGGGWSILIGKPLMERLRAVQDYGEDTLCIPREGEWTVLFNEGGQRLEPRQVLTVDENPTTADAPDDGRSDVTSLGPLQGDLRSPRLIAAGVGLKWRRIRRTAEELGELESKGEQERREAGTQGNPPRRVKSSNPFATLEALQDTVLGDTLERRLQRPRYLPQELCGYKVPRSPRLAEEGRDELEPAKEGEQVPNPPPRASRKGRRGRNKAKRQTEGSPKPAGVDNEEEEEGEWVYLMQEGEQTQPGDMDALQPEIEIGGNTSLYTRDTDAFKPERVAEVLCQIKIGPDLTEEQRGEVTDLLREYADCFALSVREVKVIPGAEHRIKVPPDVTFPKKISHQRPLPPAQKQYLNDAINELLAADIIETIRPEDVKCASPIKLAHKAHDNPGLTLEELRARVDEECVAHGMPAVYNPDHKASTTKPTVVEPLTPQKWRLCQNYAALNKVTEVFPMPQGDLRAKQLRLSGHRWVHGFDFASGFYAVAIPEECRPYLAFYIEGRGYLTPKRMPFGITGAPSTFAYYTAEKLGDQLPKLGIELFVDDGGMAGDEFGDMMRRTRALLERVRCEGLSLSAKKSQFFMTEMTFAGSTVGPDGVQADNAKLTAVVDWQTPKDLLNLSRFLGLTGYYRDLIKGYAKIAQPLTDLIRAVHIPKNAGKSAYRNAMRKFNMEAHWTERHQRAFMDLKIALTSQPVLTAPRFDGTPFIVTSDGCKEGFGAVLAQRVQVTRPGGKITTKLQPIAYASKRTSRTEECYKPFLLEFAALKFALDKFDDIIWGFPVEIETDCQALRDTLVSEDLNATHARWRDGIMAHQIVAVRHIPGKTNLVGDGLSRKDEDMPTRGGDGSGWSVQPDWEAARGLTYDLFAVDEPTEQVPTTIQQRFHNERVFLEVIEAILNGQQGATEADRKRAAYKAEGYMLEGNRLWKLGGVTEIRGTARRECITREEAVVLASAEHERTHMGRDLIKMQLIDRIHSPGLDASILKAIRSCGRCKNFGATHLHALLQPIVRRQPMELLVGDYLSMPTGRGGFTKIGLYADVYSQRLFAFKSKSAAGKNTVDSLQKIYINFTAPRTFMADGGSHFDCKEVRDFCTSIGTKTYVVAAYSPWINGLIEGSNKILLNTVKRLCAPNLGEDDYERMGVEDIPKNWPEHIDAAVKNLNERILPSFKFSPNELFFGRLISEGAPERTVEPNEITVDEATLHIAYVEQQRFDGHAGAVDHAHRRKTAFDKKVLKRAPREVIFIPGQLVQIHCSNIIHTMLSDRKLVPTWSGPRRVTNRHLNSYYLETLEGTPLTGRFSARRLRAFEPREGTELAQGEEARRTGGEELEMGHNDEDEGDEEGDGGERAGRNNQEEGTAGGAID